MREKHLQQAADKRFSLFKRTRLAVRQELPNGAYRAIRAALRVLIPHTVRRRAVQFFRSRFGVLMLSNLISAYGFPNRQRADSSESYTGDDFYRSCTLLPHLPESEVKAIVNRPMRAARQARPDVICFSIIDWSFRFQRPQQIMSQFAAHGHRVFYLSISSFRSLYERPRFAVTPIAENIFEVNIAARYPLDVFHGVIEGKDAEIALGALDELRRELSINEAISYVMIPSWCQVALKTRRRWGWRVVYDCMDEWEQFPGVKPESLEAEARLVEDCDLLVVSAGRLAEKWQSRDRPTVLARNAVDFDFYASRCQPNSLLQDTKHPVIGYFGAIADWFDIALVADAAERRPAYTFVLLGGVFDVDVSRLQSLTNVKLLGQQPYQTMPQYLYHFDVCTIPFKIYSITEATDPVKLYEYLSGGKPVVTTKMPELERYRDCVYLAENADDFIAKLDEAVAERDPKLPEQRRSLARQNNWEDRYRRIEEGLRRATPRASIIVVTHNNLALTKLCLESVLTNTGYANFQVVVVDNNSNDGTPDYLLQLAELEPAVKLILNKQNYGFAKANNQGIDLASGEYIVLLNNDTVVPAGWLSRLLRHLEDPQVGMVGPVTNFVGNEAKIEAPYNSWRQMESFARQHVWQNDLMISDIHMLAMFCVAMRREVCRQIGPLDEQFGLGMFEDDDYSMRVLQAGYRVVCAGDAFVHHVGQAAFGKLIQSGDYDRIFEENRRLYEAKWQTVWQPQKNVPLKLEVHDALRESSKTALNRKEPRRIYWLFFLSLTLLYVSLTTGTIEGQGYNQENLAAAGQVVTTVVNAVTGQPLVRIEWTRHGFVEPIFQLPFVAVSRAVFGDSMKWSGRVAIFQPILATSLLCTLLLIWAHRLTSGLRLAVLLAAGAGLGTMLWPYVYIGLETTQSLALLAAAYIALGRKPKGSWPEVLLFALSCAVAVTVKLSGVFLAPAIGFLVFDYFRRLGPRIQRSSRWKLACMVTIVAACYVLNHLARSRYWTTMDAGVVYYVDLLVDGPLSAALQAFAYFGSPNKSLLLFCPVLILSFSTLGGAWRRQPRIVTFALVTLCGLIGGFSITRMWADETWGPRYLHAAIVPLILCLAAAKSEKEFHWRRNLPTLALLLLGIVVSLLGSLFPYGYLHKAAIRSSQATLESLQYSPRWNHIRFNWQLLRVWVRGGSGGSQPEPWPPPNRWWFSKPDDAPQEKTVDLREFATPQPLMAQSWRPAMRTSARAFTMLSGLCAICLVTGLAGMALTWRLAGAIDVTRVARTTEVVSDL